MRAYALAVGARDPLHLDVAAARAAGHADLVAPPMFAAVYAAPAIGPALFDPEVGIDFALMVHAAQEFAWGPLVVAGDEVATAVRVLAIEERAGGGVYTFETVSTSQAGHVVSVGTWTNVVRGA